MPPRPPQHLGPGAIELALRGIRRWFTVGNVPVKIGMLVLLAGVVALLKYASDQGWLRMPVELRMEGIAAAPLAALIFGWRQRHDRRAFALAVCRAIRKPGQCLFIPLNRLPCPSSA